MTAPILSGQSVTFDGSTLKIVFRYDSCHVRRNIERQQELLQGYADSALATALRLGPRTEESSWRRDQTSHTIRFVAVEDGVKLEVVDWGGSGRCFVLLAGGNNHAHSFDKFAPNSLPCTRLWYQPPRVRSFE